MEFHCWRTKGSDKRPFSIGDLSLLKKDFTNRAFWKIAQVEGLIHSADGKVRVAVGKISNKANRPVYLWRAFQLLTPTEVKSCPQHNHELSPSGTRINDNQRCQHNATVVGAINQRKNFNWFLGVRPNVLYFSGKFLKAYMYIVHERSLPSPCTAFSQSLLVNSFQWRIRDERAGNA